MNYMLVDIKDGLVVKISSSTIQSYEGYLVCETDMYNEGDEFLFDLHVLEIEEDVAIQVQAMRNSPEYVPVIKMFFSQLIKNLELEARLERLAEQEERLDIIDSAIIAIGDKVWEGGA